MKNRLKPIPYARQDISRDDINAVIEVLHSDFLTQGPTVPAFEHDLRVKIGVNHAVAVSSATAALHITCLALGLKSEDWLWTTSISFVASANCALYCGAKVDFVDIDPITCNLSITKLQAKLEIAEKNGRLPRILVVVHLGGNSVDMQEIAKLSERYGFSVIEDASHALGGKYQGQYVGSCRYSDATIFSFHPVKIITSAEGGMITTNSESLAKKLLLLRSHGITRDVKNMHSPSDSSLYYEQVDLGYNYRLSDVCAALGKSQLTRLEAFVERRQYLAAEYERELSTLPLISVKQGRESYSSYHLYIVRLDLHTIQRSKEEINLLMKSKGINLSFHYIPIYRHPFYRRLGFDSRDFPESERYYSDALTLPLYPSMSDSDHRRVITAFRGVFVS